MARNNNNERLATLEETVQELRDSFTQQLTQASQQSTRELAEFREEMRAFMQIQREKEATEPRPAANSGTNQEPTENNSTPVREAPRSRGEPDGPNDWKSRQVELPTFEGSNPDGWILRAERYFSHYRMTEEEKLEAAIIALDGDALLLYQWGNRRQPLNRWEELKTLLLRKFRSARGDTLYEQWMSLQQVGGVSEYERLFIEHLAPLAGITEEVALGRFMTGLKGIIRDEVRLFKPANVDEAMDLALNVERKLEGDGTPPPERKGSANPPRGGNGWPGTTATGKGAGTPSHNSNSRGGSSGHTPTGGTGTASGGARGGTEVRRLDPKEMKERREKGLCFRCDDRWSIGHRCRRKELSVMLTGEPEDDGGNGRSLDEGGEGGATVEIISNPAESSASYPPP